MTTELSKNETATPVTDAQDTINPAEVQQPIGAQATPEQGKTGTPAEPSPSDPVQTDTESDKSADSDNKKEKSPGKISVTLAQSDLQGVALGKTTAAEVAIKWNTYTKNKRIEQNLEPYPKDKEKTEADVIKMVKDNLSPLLNEMASLRSKADDLMEDLREVMSQDGALDKDDLKWVERCAKRLKAALDKTAQVV